MANSRVYSRATEIQEEPQHYGDGFKTEVAETNLQTT